MSTPPILFRHNEILKQPLIFISNVVFIYSFIILEFESHHLLIVYFLFIKNVEKKLQKLSKTMIFHLKKKLSSVNFCVNVCLISSKSRDRDLRASYHPHFAPPEPFHFVLLLHPLEPFQLARHDR